MGEEKEATAVCVWVPGQEEWPCGFSLIPWLSGAALGLCAWAPVEAFDHEIKHMSRSFTGSCSTSPPCSVPTEPWWEPPCVLPLLSSVLPQSWAGCVCSLLKYCVCGLCRSVDQSGVCVCLWTCVRGVAVLCSIKLSYT